MRSSKLSVVTAALGLALLSANCRSADAPKADSAMPIKLESTAFKNGEEIPRQYTGDGANKSPELRISDVPKEAKELALIVEDPDAPRKDPWVHWVLYKLPPDTVTLFEGIERKDELLQPAGALQGVNDFKKTGYDGPLPPKGKGVHHYHFKIYALDTLLDLKAGATKDALLNAMKNHIVAQGELLGTYQR